MPTRTRSWASPVAEPSTPSRVVGVLGGMGPAATVDFYAKLVRSTPAARDQEHLRVVIWADPTVPSRQEALLAGGADPSPWLETGIRHLLRCGAEILVVPCNTIHAYLPAVLAGKDVEFISIIDATVEAVRETDPTGTVGLLATDGALASGLYQQAFVEAGMEVVVPSRSSQTALMDVVTAVKSGDTGTTQQQKLSGLLVELTEDGASIVVAGCTEASALLATMDADTRVVDPSQVLVDATIERALHVQE